jgi:hypothetical protein
MFMALITAILELHGKRTFRWLAIAVAVPVVLTKGRPQPWRNLRSANPDSSPVESCTPTRRDSASSYLREERRKMTVGNGLAQRIREKNDHLPMYRSRIPKAPIWLLIYSCLEASRGVFIPAGELTFPFDFERVLFLSCLDRIMSTRFQVYRSRDLRQLRWVSLWQSAQSVIRFSSVSSPSRLREQM